MAPLAPDLCRIGTTSGTLPITFSTNLQLLKIALGNFMATAT
jgi:hypothetical protein